MQAAPIKPNPPAPALQDLARLPSTGRGRAGSQPDKDMGLWGISGLEEPME